MSGPLTEQAFCRAQAVAQGVDFGRMPLPKIFQPPDRKFFLALLIIGIPVAVPYVARSCGFFAAKFSALPAVGVIVFGGVISSLLLLVIAKPVLDATSVART